MIDKTAIIHPSAQIAEDAIIGPYVVIGENGVGKTSLLKMIYAATQWSIEKTDVGKTRQLLHFFSDHLKDNMLLRSRGMEDGYCYFKVSDGEHYFEYSLSHEGFFDFDQWLGLNMQSVYIPVSKQSMENSGNYSTAYNSQLLIQFQTAVRRKFCFGFYTD